MADSARLAQLHERFRASLPQKSEELKTRWRAVASNDAYALDELLRYVHRLAGSTGMYGYEELARLARSVEHVLKQPSEGGPASVVLEDSVQALITAIDGLDQ